MPGALFTTFHAYTPDGERFSQAVNSRCLLSAPISIFMFGFSIMLLTDELALIAGCGK